MSTFLYISVLAFCGVLSGCSGSKFKGASTAESSSPAQEQIEPYTEQEPAPEAGEPGASTPTAPLVKDEDKEALDACIQQWGGSPFTPQEIAEPNLVEINDDVNNNSVIYVDDKVTSKPTLFLINFNITVGNKGQLAFLNPKGWYCFNVKAKIINNFVINAGCDTHVAIVSKLAQNDKRFAIEREPSCPAVP